MTETEDERKVRLFRKAQQMREARAAKQDCSTSELDSQMGRFMRLYARHAQDNVAITPIDMWFDGSLWNVDVHVHIKRVTEYDFTTTSETLADALAHATATLYHQRELRAKGLREAETFGFDY